MKNVLIIIVLIFFAYATFAQKPKAEAKPGAAKKPAVAKKVALKTSPTPIDPTVEKRKLDDALALPSAAERASALKKFVNDFPISEQRPRALELLVTARAALGDEMLQANETENGVKLFKLAIEEAPQPIPDRLFSEVVSKFPANLFYRGQRAGGLEIAAVIEKKAAGKIGQLLNLATFYLGIESGSDAKRLAEAALQIDPNSAAAYQTLGLAHRLNFELEESAKAYSKALELDAESSASKRSLAEMKRALGKPDEAAALYREILIKYENDIPARTGLILSLFGAGKKAEAESEMTKSLEQNPSNLNLLAGTAYWYAARDEAEKAVQLAQKAVQLEPRFIWSHIALARGLLSQKKPVDAERVLVTARRFGNFPTLEYEIASARLMAGFYREAVEELQKSFSLKDGMVQTKLGGRISREEKSFADLIGFERRASIFEPHAADNSESAAKLKLLFEMTQKLKSAELNESEITVLVDEFTNGDDKMKLHRQLYAASLLLQKKIALPKVLELVKSAVGNTDSGLDVAAPAAAVMASELYESRTIAFSRNEVVLVPDVPRQTLSAILRGRIEELSGWTFYQQNSFPEAVVRLRRAISVLPEKSAWWRSSMWRLGSALEADGKDKEALDSYMQSYKSDRPDALKYIVVESLYKKVNGSTDGLEAKIGVNPLPTVAGEVMNRPEIPVKITENNTRVVSETSEARKTAERKTESVTPAEAVPEPETSVHVTPKSEDASQEILKVAPEKEPTLEKTSAPKDKPVSENDVAQAQTAPREPKPVSEETLESQPPIEPLKESSPTHTVERTSKEIVPNVKAATPETELKADDPLKNPSAMDAQQVSAKNAVLIGEGDVADLKTPISSKELFEPVIITVPGRSLRKPTKSETEKLAETTVEENGGDPKTEPEKGKPSNEAVSTAPREVVDDAKVEADRRCWIEVGRDNVSILNAGGSVGVLVGIKGDGDVKDIIASSSSPADVDVKLEPAIDATSGHSYIVKSTSTAVGIYQITFESPCGKKKIVVKVR